MSSNNRRRLVPLIALCFALVVVGFPAPLFSESKSSTRKSKKGLQLELTYPVGESPKVFDHGWIFGAKAILNPGTDREKDISRRVRWSGTAKFRPKRGSESRPTFRKKNGTNRIRLRVKVGRRIRTKVYKVETVKAEGTYATIGSTAFAPVDGHGCPYGPFAVRGPVTTGSTLVSINGLPAARKGDRGIHASCCGPNVYEIVEGDPEVLIEGQPAARVGDKTQHCGGNGTIESVDQLPTPTPLPVPDEYGVFGVVAAGTDFLIIDTEENVARRKPCTFDGGGLDCTSDVDYSLLAGPFLSEEAAGQAMCAGISDGQYWALTKCKRRYLYNGKWYWGCESSVAQAVNSLCPENRIEVP